MSGDNTLKIEQHRDLLDNNFQIYSNFFILKYFRMRGTIAGLICGS